MKKIKFIQEQGKCPKCGSDDVDYGDSNIDGETISYELTCNKCGCQAEEYYNLNYSETIIN